MRSLGRHIVVEFFGCDPEILNDVAFIEECMLKAAQEANATVINSTFHHFSPFGVSGVIVIQESHLAIHTWPEYEFAAVDIFTCGDSVNPWICYQILYEGLKAKHGSAIEMGRGQKDLLPRTQVNYEKIVSTYPKENITPKFIRNIWFTERDDTIALSLRHTGDVLYRKKSPYQKVEIYDTFAYGKMMVLDGMIMTAEKDEYVYHEMIAHVPLLTLPNPKKVLVIGGGDGGALREVLRHPSIEEAILVEIDPYVIEAAKQFLPQLACSFDHPKAKVIIEDGVKYVKNAPSNTFDLVIVDSTDPLGPGEGLFTREFYENVYRILTDKGIMVTQSESPRYSPQLFQELYFLYYDIFGKEKVHCYLIAVPTYPTGTWSLSYCSKGGIHPTKDFDAEKARAFTQEHQLKYYNEEVHPAAFALPNYVKELLQK